MLFLFSLIVFAVSITHTREVFSLDRYQVIFLPEEHTSKEDHDFQLSIIKLLFSRGYKFLIAMEMFQQPFQQALDEYIACKIDEEEMLKRTQYSKRWSFDPSFYRDIWMYAKDKGIRLKAINISSELVHAIRSKGLDRVGDDSLPHPIIPNSEKEMQELKKTLASHPKVDKRRFFDVQNAWDNGMALAISRLMDKYAGYKVVVLVGRGHAIDYDMGIPRRLKILKPEVRIKILKREDFQRDLLFSIDFSNDSSSATSMSEPNCRP
ncbi:MAG: ChaN family lipoprotein [Aquificaceae bacterium]|nr:ChaN family lipoprotein [Aquificaceae bacterium]